jgi:hypothetical protein
MNSLITLAGMRCGVHFLADPKNGYQSLQTAFYRSSLRMMNALPDNKYQQQLVCALQETSSTDSLKRKGMSERSICREDVIHPK